MMDCVRGCADELRDEKGKPIEVGEPRVMKSGGGTSCRIISAIRESRARPPSQSHSVSTLPARPPGGHRSACQHQRGTVRQESRSSHYRHAASVTRRPCAPSSSIVVVREPAQEEEATVKATVRKWG